MQLRASCGRAGAESGAEGRLVVGQFHPDAAGFPVSQDFSASSGRRQDEKGSAVPLRVGVLGPVTVWRDGHEIMAGQPRQLAVLGLLATRANRVVSRGELVDAVWGDQPPASVDSGIYTYVAGLRRVLEPDRPRRDPDKSRRAPGRVLVSSGGGYLLRLGPGGLDAAQFEERPRPVARAARVRRLARRGAGGGRGAQAVARPAVRRGARTVRGGGAAAADRAAHHRGGGAGRPDARPGAARGGGARAGHAGRPSTRCASGRGGC